jgi:hypothetical protein
VRADVEVRQRSAPSPAASPIAEKSLAGEERGLVRQRRTQVDVWGSASSRSSILANPIDTSAFSGLIASNPLFAAAASAPADHCSQVGSAVATSSRTLLSTRVVVTAAG